MCHTHGCECDYNKHLYYKLGASTKPIVELDQIIWEEKDNVAKMELLVYISDVWGQAIRKR